MFRVKAILKDEKQRARYFHEMAGDSRTLELLLNTCYRIGITPLSANDGSKEGMLSNIVLELNKKNLNSIGVLMDLVEEIPNSEFNIKSNSDEITAELSFSTKDSEQFFTLIKDTLEASVIEKNHGYSYTVMSTVYNIAKIVKEALEANVSFATNEKLYDLGKCGVSLYKDNQADKVDTKNPDDIYEIIEKLKTKFALHLPTIFFCSFEELRTFYFELDETVYSKDIDGDNNGQ
ncbi:MAG: hypothetical protein IKJ43_02360 [Bacilli bacterium]|nr:hypothetical protein [Bacilli bacterium]